MIIWTKLIVGSILMSGGVYASLLLGEKGFPIFGFTILAISLMGIGGYLFVQALQEDEK